MSFLDSARKVLPFGTEMAHLRGATLLEYAGHWDEALENLKVCLLSQNVAIRSYALALMVFNEAKARRTAGPHDASLVDPAVDTLLEVLSALRSGRDSSDFSLEAEVFVLYNLCSLYTMSRHYRKAMQVAGEAIYISLPLKTTNLTSAARMSYALAALNIGQTHEALQEYQRVMNIPTANGRQKLLAALNCCTLHAAHGEDVSAARLMDRVREQHGDGEEVRITWQYLRAVDGLLPPDEQVYSCSEGDTERLTRALQLLVQSTDPRNKGLLADTLAELKNWQPRSQFSDAVAQWIQSSALLKQGKPFLAAQRLELAQPLYPLAQVLTLATKIEIALHPEGVETEPLADLARQVQRVLRTAASPEARNGLAEKLALWQPLAAAFVAMSPYSTSELVDAAMPAIFVDGKPIQVHGVPVPSRLPFVQLSLEAFGIEATVHRDQSVERERMNSALTVPWGQGQRRLPVVPPALLIFHYVRLAETEGPLWRMAGRELANSHGLIPVTMGANLRMERLRLSELLAQLLDEQITTVQFRQQLSMLKQGVKTA
ncbi:hypothetical protein [Deinococcus hopiensis]|uniref:hypothetical protein n=1 Tax=Deinococcus hopiensis TaxID=309885 RepID=UPI00111C5787|nr:hypothetical protein [Deinococcus hopiensis]